MKLLTITSLLFFTMFVGTTSAQTFTLNKQEIVPAMERVADWQIANFTYSTEGSPYYLHDWGIDAWTNATLFIGMFRWAEIANNDKYFDWLMNIGNTTQWKAPTHLQNTRHEFYHADELAILQFYELMYRRFGKIEMIADSRWRLDKIMNNPGNMCMTQRNLQTWSWCDALFMAPPAFIGMWDITGDERYLNFANKHFKITWRYLYHPDERLFFRDDRFFDRREANGEHIFWGRGNGWTAAGITNILKIIPQGHDARAFYELLFREHVSRLASLQNRETGFWHASLLDPASFPAPEASATAMITFAIAYGVNSGLLCAETYAPIVDKAWRALLTAIHDCGKLGWVQPIGADPRLTTKDMTHVYGVGAFLMAGAEIMRGMTLVAE